MSWNNYVKEFLMTPGDMVSAGIYGLDGGEWAAEGGVRPQPAEITRLIGIIRETDKDFNGIKINGMSYLHVTHDATEGSIILSRINAPEKEKFVCSGYLANQCFVFGVSSVTMSWNDHVVSLSKGPSIKMAGIFGKDGNPWAVSSGFNPTPQEILLLVKLAEGKPYSGDDRITLCGQKYMYKDEPYEGLLSVLSLGGAEKYICTVGMAETGVIVGVAAAAAAGASREYLDKYKKYLKGIGY